MTPYVLENINSIYKAKVIKKTSKKQDTLYFFKLCTEFMMNSDSNFWIETLIKIMYVFPSKNAALKTNELKKFTI